MGNLLFWVSHYYDKISTLKFNRAFQLKENGLYFYRLSIIPEKQGQGIAKKILKSLEDYANNKGIPTLLCKVRMTVPKNIKLYSSIGYIIYKEEVVHKPNGINTKVVSMEKQL